MILPAIPSNDAQRLEELNRYKILDTVPEQEYDNLISIASTICETPIALFSLVDKDRQWFKSKRGLNTTETSREVSFCAHAINEVDQLFEISDTSKDKRFFDNPLTNEGLNIKFYAGMPIKSSSGKGLGTICVIDSKPRKLNDNQRETLKALSKQISFILEQRLCSLQTKRHKERLETIFENVDDFIFELNPSGELTSVNHALKKTLELPYCKIIGRHFTDFIKSKEKKASILQQFENQVKNKIQLSNYEFSFQTINAKKISVKLTVKLVLDENGQVSIIICLAKDVSVIKKKRKKLKRLSTVAETTTSGVVILNKDFEIKWVNHSFEGIFGYKLSEIKGKQPGEFLNGKLTD